MESKAIWDHKIKVSIFALLYLLCDLGHSHELLRSIFLVRDNIIIQMMSWVGRSTAICKILLHSWFKPTFQRIRNFASLTSRPNGFQRNQEKKNSLSHYEGQYVLFITIFHLTPTCTQNSNKMHSVVFYLLPLTIDSISFMAVSP